MGDFATGGQYYLGVGVATVDNRLNEEILEAVSPHGLKASVAAIKRLSHEGTDKRLALQRQIQQAHYEAQRASEQYDKVDPANRLVAEVLEQRWNDQLETLGRLKGELDAHSDATGKLILEGNALPDQRSLFDDNQ